MEQILIRNLPTGTKAALKLQAREHNRSVEAELRAIVTAAIAQRPTTLVDLLSADEGHEFEFEPGRVGLTARTAQL